MSKRQPTSHNELGPSGIRYLEVSSPRPACPKCRMKLMTTTPNKMRECLRCGYVEPAE